MKRLALLALLVCMAATIQAQSPNASSQCTLSVAQSPEIRGIRLGLSVDKLLLLFPEDANRNAIQQGVRDSKRADNYGMARFDLRADPAVTNARFSGVGVITVEMLDEHVTSFYVSYDGPYWKSVDQFIGKLSEALKLPSVDNWKMEAGDSSRSLQCNGFSVSVHTSGGANNYVWVRDASVQESVKDRREASREKARQAFKP